MHGIVGNKNAFKKEIAKLKEQYHCICYDLYDVHEVGLSLTVLIERLSHQYKKAKLKKAHLCALSFGSLIAVAFAKKYPDMVESITVVGGYCCQVPSRFYTNVTTMLEKKDQIDYEEWVCEYARLLNPNVDSIAEDSEAIFIQYAKQVHPVVLEKLIRMQLEFDSKTALAGLTMPVLWVMGEYDELYKGTLSHLKTQIPHVEYHEIQRAGHVAHIHQPELFMLLFQTFLRKGHHSKIA